MRWHSLVAGVRRFWRSRRPYARFARRAINTFGFVLLVMIGYELSDAVKRQIDTVVYTAATLTVDYFYRHLHVAENNELPPSASSFSYGPQIASVIGGKGEGLDCSIPRLANPAFRLERGDAGVSFKFRQACVVHDLCYRHGLATYGYSQADCDFAFQQAAFRICSHIEAPDTEVRVVDDNGVETVERQQLGACRLRSKIALLGVRFGGPNSYRGWDQSTYYEYETMPHRSEEFMVSRAVRRANPLPGQAPEALLTIRSRPSGSWEMTTRRTLAIGNPALPTSPVVSSSDGSWLLFAQRQTTRDTWLTVTALNSASLPRRPADTLRLPPQERSVFFANLGASTPVILQRADQPAQNSRLFALAPRVSNRFSAMLFDKNAPCRPNNGAEGEKPYLVWPIPNNDFERTDLTLYRYRFFQTAPLAGPFSLPDGRRADALVVVHGRTLPGGSDMAGDAYRAAVDIVALDLSGPRDEKNCLIVPHFTMFRDVPVSETMQPLMLLETLDGNGLIGMRKTGGGWLRGERRLTFHEVWLNGGKPRVTEWERTGPALHASFADRPPLVLKPGALGPGTDAGLLLSRGRLAASSLEDKGEIVRMQFAALERKGNSWKTSHAAVCDVTYRIRRPNAAGECGVAEGKEDSLLPRRWLRSATDSAGVSIGNQLRAGQLLAGSFVAGQPLTLALVDMCRPLQSIRLVASAEGGIGSFTAWSADIPLEPPRFTPPFARSVECRPIPPQCLAEPLDAAAVKRGGICTGYPGISARKPSIAGSAAHSAAAAAGLARP